ncbi:MAG: ribosomal protein S18-alanine N-acetyltransferase [Thermoleophilia bacterium]
MTQDDLPRIVELENRIYPSPWTYRMFLGEVRNPVGWTRVLVADETGAVVAYLVSRFYGDFWHLMNLAVSPEYRGRGLGGFLLDELVLLAADSGADLTLEVRVSNQSAIRLYRRRGFRSVGRRPGYYRDANEDAMIMTRRHDEAGREDA